MIDEQEINKHKFYFETSLYKKNAIKDFDKDVFNGEIEGYSSFLNDNTTYSISIVQNDESFHSGLICNNGKLLEKQSYNPGIMGMGGSSGQDRRRHKKGFFTVTLTCKRKSDKYLIYLFVDDNDIIKIGQWPSLADIQYSELGKKYDKVLPDEDIRNLKKAIGLYAHSAGAGSFVYLRRIFENLIRSTFHSNESSLSIKEDVFIKMYMSDKIDILKDYLPEQLVKMSQIYSIMSKGVHELTEEDCLKYFSPIKLSIELILDQKIEMTAKTLKDKEAQKQLDTILKEIK